MARIQLLVGSETGTAEIVAEALREQFATQAQAAVVNSLPSLEDIQDHPEDILLICTANTGSGELPGSLQPLYLSLVRDTPPLVGRRYGLINLGDSSYVTFAEAGQTIDDALADLGAERIGEPLVLDASSGLDPVEEALEWATQWAEKL